MPLQLEPFSSGKLWLELHGLPLALFQKRLKAIVEQLTVLTAKIISKMANDGHFGFGAFAELAHTFARAWGLNFLFNFHRR